MPPARCSSISAWPARRRKAVRGGEGNEILAHQTSRNRIAAGQPLHPAFVPARVFIAFARDGETRMPQTHQVRRMAIIVLIRVAPRLVSRTSTQRR